jgi:hypothetical protein
MRIIFSVISIAYIAAIFLFASSRVVSDLAPFNPYSILHIPLYGILTVLLIFSFVPIKLNRVNASTHQRINAINEPNVPNDPNGPNDSNKPMTESPNNSITQSLNDSRFSLSFFLPCVIALMIAIADEIHQSVIPARDASITDVFLDAIGILLALFLIVKFYRKKKFLLHLAQPTN